MQYLLVLTSSLFVNVPSVLLVLVYARVGTFEDSASLGIALAYAAPLYLFFSMQHGLAVLAGTRSWTSVAALRVKLAPLYLIAGALVAQAYGESQIFYIALLRFGDLLFDARFCDWIRQRQAKTLFIRCGTRLAVFALVLFVAALARLPLSSVLLTIAVLNLVATLATMGIGWTPEVRQARLSHGDLFMGGAACLASLSANVPRYFLVNAHAGDLAAYSNLLTIVMAGTLLFISFNNQAFARAAAAGHAGISRFMMRSVLACMTGIALAWLLVVDNHGVSRFLTTLALGPRYTDYANLVPLFWVLYCLLFLQNVANSALAYLEASRYIFAANLILIVLLAVAFVWVGSSLTAWNALLIMNASMVGFVCLLAAFVASRLRGVHLSSECRG